MLNDLWLFISGLLVFIGLLASEGLLIIVGSLVILIWLATKLWDRFAFRKVSHSRRVARHRAFIGDTFEYTVTLRNDKVLPLIWVDIQESFPDGLDLAGAKLRANNIEGMRQHSITTSLLPFQQATWKYNLRCTARGLHRIGPVRVRSGDIFGFSASEARFEELEHVIVYPRVVDLEQLGLPFQHPLGEGRGRRPLFYDSSQFAGHRDYLPSDPMKHIDWKATARAPQIQTKLFAPVVSLNVLVALNAATSEEPWETSNRRLFERGVTVAASVASYAAKRGYSFGLVSNAVATYSAKYISVPLGAAPSQLPLVLESLAMAGPYVVTTLPEVLKGERDKLPAGATVVLVTAVVTPSLTREIAEMKERGYQLLLLYAGDGFPDLQVPDVEMYLVGPAVDKEAADEPVLAE